MPTSMPDDIIHCISYIPGAFTKLQKATNSFIIRLSACPSVHMEELGSLWTDIHDI
jgi:hypothetical protein